MATAVIMPKFEMAQETGTVARWLKSEGETVKKGEPLLEVETDKVTMEVEAPASGVLVSVTAQAGLVVPIGQPIAFIAKPGEQVAPGPSATAAAPASGSAALGASAASAAAVPSVGSNRAPAAGPAAPSAAPARQGAAPAASGGNANYLATPLAVRLATEHGLPLNSVPGTGLHGRITSQDVEEALASLAAHPASGPTVLWPEGKVRAAPAARRLARELDVDLHALAGTGPEGRIQPTDVLAAAAARAEEPASRVGLRAQQGSEGAGLNIGGLAAGGQAVAQPPADSSFILHPSSFEPTVRRVVPLTSIRRTIAERMTASVREAPQFTVSADVEIARALALVDDVKAAAEGKEGPKVTLTAFLLKACAWALASYPAANSSFDQDANAGAGGILEWADVNVGVATATDAGLLVPVIHGADHLGLAEIASRMSDITARARAGKLRIEDIQGGTFTLSNLGMFGIDQFAAILNPPQAAILAVGRVAKRPVVDESGQIIVRQLSTLTLTADHRVLDGASAAQFLAIIKKVLEHPGILLA